MKQSFKLEKIDKTGGGVEVVDLICTMQSNGEKERITFKLSCTSIAVRITSDHLVYEMKHICDPLKNDIAIGFAKKMIEANKLMKTVLTV